MKKIILASKSPRRIEMLSKYFENVIIYPSDIFEKVNEYDMPETTVMKIAFEKAMKVYNECRDEGIIISADTIVFLDKILGKPKDFQDGFNMLKLLSGNTHSVFTGFCVIDSATGMKVVDYEKTFVEFNELSDDFIIKYLNKGEYIDKAGAYGIQGYGELLVKKINGCYNNVKGLPMNKLNNIMTKHFYQNLL
ncbi:MAG: Maf family protein [Sedimentibacter sp.]|uniref:nucleoside triphosphate pyrophosphatase n=1 Tax=Sedimentibacter sp. TaxID=1960295 RepID=UPI0029812A76|nr:Maf family protein [Sedimentibacter sp.]MDW5300203.1 Maf family protein [Sedimentibacter sp.]